MPGLIKLKESACPNDGNFSSDLNLLPTSTTSTV
jgi:hypothetical protein